MQGPPTEFPRESADARQRFDDWLDEYERRTARYATCRFLEAIGNDRIHPGNRQVLQVHDARTRAESARGLA